jgi:putative ABC transport system permease protein
MRHLLRTAPIAWRMLTDRPLRTLLSSLGVTFSVLIMFMELGFFNGSNDSSANLPPLFDCDLVMSSREKTHMKTGEEFHWLRLQQLRGVDGVGTAVPLYTGATYWWNPQDHTRNRVFVLGVDPDNPMIKVAAIAEHREELKADGAVLYDRLSRRDLGVITPGMHTTLGYAAVHVVGLFDLGPNFTYEGHLIAARDTFLKALGDPPTRVDLALIRLEPGQTVDAVRTRIYAALPNDILLLTPQELYSREVLVTTRRSPAGIVFGIGLLVGFGIGVIVCYQILFNEVTDNLPQFATMKAMGHQAGFISGIVLNEALFLSFVGYLPGLLASYYLYQAIEHFTQIRMFLTVPRALLIFVLAGGMCLAAGRLALRKVHAADPADLY